MFARNSQLDGEQAKDFYNDDYIHAPNMYRPWQVYLYEQALRRKATPALTLIEQKTLFFLF